MTIFALSTSLLDFQDFVDSHGSRPRTQPSRTAPPGRLLVPQGDESVPDSEGSRPAEQWFQLRPDPDPGRYTQVEQPPAGESTDFRVYAHDLSDLLAAKPGEGNDVRGVRDHRPRRGLPLT